MDEVGVKERLDEIEEKLDKLDDCIQSVVNPEKKTGVEAVAAYTNALKASVKSQTEFQASASTVMSRARTDDVFTSLLMQHGRKPVEYPGWRRIDQLRQYGRVSGKPIKGCQEMFISETDSNEETNPKSVLITGKAGIGKTLFCQKLIRDWAEDKLFQLRTNPNCLGIKFAYLLTFRQLNLLGDDHVTLREILNRSSVLDDCSNVDDSIIKYILHHPEEVLIIIDGYDEYSQADFITKDLDERYPNNAQEKMPVAALCTKLIKGKILRGSVVVITSRPDESDRLKGRIGFYRYVEITGFSKKEVKEFIEKYFKGDEIMKNAVMDHIAKNDNLVSFAHIPVLCFLMCSYFEYILKESMDTDALPVNTIDIYFEVVNMFLRNHDKSTASPPEGTLEKLSEFAAHLLWEKKFNFLVEDMKMFSSEEVENFRASGVLHSSPPFRKSFSETTKYFCFTHITLQEYLAARWFVKRKEIPSLGENASTMVFQFMSGILSKQNDKALMEKLIERLTHTSLGERTAALISMKCITEYQHKEFAQNMIKKRYHQFFINYEEVEFEDLNDVDCIAVSFLLDVVSALNAEETAGRYSTHFKKSRFSLIKRLNLNRCFQLTKTGLRRITTALEREFCTITELRMRTWQFDDESADVISKLLSLSVLNKMSFFNSRISNAGVASLCRALQTPSSQVTELGLSGCQITDAGVVSLCHALQSASCKVTTLHLKGNQITDAGVVSLCQALQVATCKVTALDLSGNQISDDGVASLCQALQTATSRITTLYLGYNDVTDVGVASLFQALQEATCEVSALDLSGNQITDAGVVSLCQALPAVTCKITRLDLTANQITDAGVLRLCQALQSPTCKVTELKLVMNRITKSGEKRLRNLRKQRRDLDLGY
ncbi:NACHT, LRR and PYD domains-containing protein 12-like [Stylophora pistillata]|uniref:NACHT, LRR and PYD domains-containing protein 12-like n=1 Tax=Stylophora pistillata TaxID=50429 RepID=UPI000C03E304|nr:NACHT, LRR and PYD domains-containing protein 12-like [Stylophora pistillata]